MTPDESVKLAQEKAYELNQPAYVYWEGDAFTGGLQVYCGPYDYAPGGVKRGYDVFAVVIPSQAMAGDVFFRVKYPRVDN